MSGTEAWVLVVDKYGGKLSCRGLTFPAPINCVHVAPSTYNCTTMDRKDRCKVTQNLLFAMYSTDVLNLHKCCGKRPCELLLVLSKLLHPAS